MRQHTTPMALGPARRLDAEAALDHIDRWLLHRRRRSVVRIEAEVAPDEPIRALVPGGELGRRQGVVALTDRRLILASATGRLKTIPPMVIGLALPTWHNGQGTLLILGRTEAPNAVAIGRPALLDLGPTPAFRHFRRQLLDVKRGLTGPDEASRLLSASSPPRRTESPLDRSQIGVRTAGTEPCPAGCVCQRGGNGRSATSS